VSAILSIFEAVLDAVAAVFQAAIALLLLAMLTINAVNIVSRSFLGGAIDWVFHWTILMFVWMVCLGFYVYIRANRDVVVDLITSRLSALARRAIAIAADMIGLLFMFMVLSPATQLIALQTGYMESIALPIYVSSLPLFFSAVLLVVHFTVHALLVATGEIDPFRSKPTHNASGSEPSE
jgi:TRAP-type C4-dicarboxylate transport system permease small subunit